jgi:hypothetical protein
MTEYAKGFDHGCDYIIAEIEKYIQRREFEPRITEPLNELLRHLKVADEHEVV